MKSFADLYAALDRTTKTNEKVAALVHYFRTALAAEAAWALFFLSGRKFRRAVSYPRLRQWALERSGIPAWLFDECLDAVGDVAETIALLVPASGQPSERSLDEWVRDWILPLAMLDECEQRQRIVDAWG